MVKKEGAYLQVLPIHGGDIVGDSSHLQLYHLGSRPRKKEGCFLWKSLVENKSTVRKIEF